MKFARRAGACIVVVAAGLGGCASRPGPASAPAAAAEAPAYADVVDRYNERADRLGRIWARAVARIEYVDEDGDLRREQGEGHLQFIGPDRLAISLGKLSEVLFWLGSDAERFWFFDLQSEREVAVGRHENMGRACAQNPGLPALPLDIIELLGVTPLPPEGTSGWSADGRWVVARAPARAGMVEAYLDPASLEPGWIFLYPNEQSVEPSVRAELTSYALVTLEGTSIFPRMASRITITTPGEQGSIRMTLNDLDDGAGSRGRLNARVFEFESLLKALRPESIVVLDEGCERPAYQSPAAAAPVVDARP